MRVLFVGQTPETVDYSDPALPPGLNAKKIQAGVACGYRLRAGNESGHCAVKIIS
jgi:hypothetical protein